ncbi:hypothetical protein [Sulfitobacter aestuariivivens]|uniref:Uncharacterized protein n=1 Tax=Sulfitobacter aestuariivivens TaxID=2766981 RepID=A0A927HGU7_9RHOB|nr:hypothetical protein [Sulfitobacter aestuariivivens]MBD3665873.1 hypothetical protein [Sulfitobacter aestuariivivens]
MSSILLTNPFASVPSAPQAATEGPVAPLTIHAVTPAQTGSTARGAGNAASYTGTGSGQGRSIGSASQQAVLSDRRDALRTERPPNATANSVVGAQSRESDASATVQPNDQDSSLRSPAGLVPSAPAAQAIEIQMPDPLPTSPFLKMMSGRG